MTTISESLSLAGTKRPHSSPNTHDYKQKKRRKHGLRHVQSLPQNIEPASQDPAFVQQQLLRSITAALTLAGFDGATASALEMFRSHVEEYMLRFLTYIRTSMHGGRRTKPIAPDFSMALSLTPDTSTASMLRPQLDLAIPDAIACPSISAPDPPLPPAPDLSALLEPLLVRKPPPHIPTHFPPLPPRHSWMATPVFPKRETDPRKMREKATQEGMLAEQALRRLAAAAKAGAVKAERRRTSNALSGPGKLRDDRAKKVEERQELFADLMDELGKDSAEGRDGDAGHGLASHGAGDAAMAIEGIDLGMPEGVVVNYDMEHWRRGGLGRALRF